MLNYCFGSYLAFSFLEYKALLSLCSDEFVAAKGAVNLCITHMHTVLSSQYLPRGASMETMSRAYHATETYVQVCSLLLGIESSKQT
jgi:hypothetical protein